MSVEANKTIARKFLEHFTTGSLDFDALYHRDYVHHNDAFYPDLEPGLDGFKRGLTAHGGGLSDVRIRIDHLVGEGDKVVARFTVTARHTGNFHGFEATGRNITFTATDIYRFKDGKIAEGWAVIDFLAIMQALGARPVMGSPRS